MLNKHPVTFFGIRGAELTTHWTLLKFPTPIILLWRVIEHPAIVFTDLGFIVFTVE